MSLSCSVPHVLYVVIDVLSLRGIAPPAQHVPDAVRGKGYAVQVAITAHRSDGIESRTALIDGLMCRGSMSLSCSVPLVLYVVIDVLSLRGIAQLAQHMPDAVRGEGYDAAQVSPSQRTVRWQRGQH